MATFQSNPIEKYHEAQIEALNSVLIGNEAYYYRKMCRYISEHFNIPLLEAEKLPVDYVLLHYYESHFESLENNTLVDLAKELCCPEIVKQEDEQIQAVLKDLEIEQEHIMGKKAPKKESLAVEKQKEFNLTFDEE